MRKYSSAEIEALTNWDGLLCKPPWRNNVEKRQYYARFINRLLWQYFDEKDWQNVADVMDELRVEEKLKKTTRFLLQRHLGLR